MASNQAYYLCIKHLTDECKYSVCKNVHPENIKQANEEYVNKKIPRICYKYNFGPDGCPFKICKFLHIYIKHQPSNTIVQQVSTPVKIDNLLSNIRSAVIYMDTLVNKLQADQENLNIKVPNDVIMFQENVYANLSLLLNNLETNLRILTI